jgi:excisionase family DNA binding protein
MTDASQYPQLTIPQVAARLHVSQATLFRFLADGKGPVSYKVGKRRLFRESDVLSWLERECRQKSAA